MQQLLSCGFCKIPNCSLCNAILEVGVDAAKGKCLLWLFCMLYECLVGKTAVVAMIMVNSDATLTWKLFVCLFCLERLCRRLVFHEIDITQSWKMINNDGAVSVSLGGKFSLELSDESNLGGLELVY